MAVIYQLIVLACILIPFISCQDCQAGYYGDNCLERCGFCVDGDVCHQNGSCAGGCIANWEGATCKTRVNVALNKTATQGPETYWDPNFAVDGCIGNDDPDNTLCCAAATVIPAGLLFWRVYYGVVIELGLVQIYGRTDNNAAQLEGFQMFGKNNSSPGDEVLVYTDTGAYPGNGLFTINVNGTFADSVEIRRTSDVLTLCEVLIFPACPPRTHGDQCTRCGACANNDVCDRDSGVCPNGCAAGWQGNNCDAHCQEGNYGMDCSMMCGNCFNDTACDREDGACPAGCDTGYNGTLCSETCTNGTYGYNCNETCGACRDGAHCDFFNGTCDAGCDAGVTGDVCKTECGPGYYGYDCQDQCYCTDGEACDRVNGTCPGTCSPGYTGDTCNTTCEAGMFGQNCSATCGWCLNGTACNVVNGTCEEGCAAGYLLHNCTEACPDGSYGMDCSESCGNCLDNETCSHTNGTCTMGCAAGWQGDFCKTACENGTFGENCATQCYCADGVACSIVTGLCPNGECDVGYTGEFCHQDLNRAKGQPTNQSSTYIDTFIWSSELAVDGNKRQSDPDSSMTCSATTSEDNPWWCVDMEQISVIDFVLVYGRTDMYPEMLQGFQMYLSNTTDFLSGQQVYDSTGVDYGDGVFNVTLANSALARHICIQLPGSGRTLTLCEVRVFGECPDGTFGMECEEQCHCADDVPCDKLTGNCTNGACDPGWATYQCSEPCPDTTYGQDCSGTCGTCRDNAECNKVNGTCEMGCAPGWLNDTCNQACADGNYGDGCNMTCGNCKGDDICNKANGTCQQGCDAGFSGSFCMDECLDGNFGENCATTCGSCQDNATCDGTTGHCPTGCVPGFVEPQCISRVVQDPPSDDGLSTGEIVGVVVGVLAALVLIGLVYKCVANKRKSQKASATERKYEDLNPETVTHQRSSHYAAYSLNEGYQQQSKHYDTKL